MTVSWRGHVKSVTSLTMVEEHKILLSSSVDCTVRMWNMEGHYIGRMSGSLALEGEKKVARVPSKDSDQPGHLPSLISFLCPLEES